MTLLEKIEAEIAAKQSEIMALESAAAVVRRLENVEPKSPKKRNAGASRNWHEQVKHANGKPLSDEYRLKLARCIAEKGPASVLELSSRTGISRHGMFSVAKLSGNHEWFELDSDRMIHLTPAGHQAATGKGETQ